MPRAPGGRSHKLVGLYLACLLGCLILYYQVYVKRRGSGYEFELHPEHNSLEREGPVVLSDTVRGPSTDLLASLGPFRFPKLIHQTVKDKSTMSCQQRKVIASWKVLNPGYGHRLWDDADIQQFMERYYPELVPTPYNAFLAGAERSDLWRVLVLHKFGGVYADLDVQCLQPIDHWNADHGFDAQVLLGVENYEQGREHPLHVTNWVLAAMPEHPMLGMMPATVSKSIQRQFLQLAKVSGTLNTATYEAGIIDRTGPAALSWLLYDYLTQHADVSMNGVSYSNVTSPEGFLAGGVRLLPTDYMSAGWEVAEARAQGQSYTCDDVARDKPNALVCHMFWGSWRGKWRFAQEQTFDDC